MTPHAPATSWIPHCAACATPLTPTEVAALRQHRVWADKRISALIRRVGDAEAPARAEAAKLANEVAGLRRDKEGMQARLRDLERSIARIKEQSCAEAALRRWVVARWLATAAGVGRRRRAGDMRRAWLCLEAGAQADMLLLTRAPRSEHERQVAAAVADLQAANLREQVRVQFCSLHGGRGASLRCAASAAAQAASPHCMPHCCHRRRRLLRLSRCRRA